MEGEIRSDGNSGKKQISFTSQNTYSKKREYGIDLLKLLACIGIVAIHTIDVKLGFINRIIGTSTVVCIPLFFMISGFLAFRKKEVTLKYCLNKIVRILVICFVWEFLYSTAVFCYTREIRNFLLSFLLDFIQKGLFFHFWYLGVMIILYLLLPFLHKLNKTNPKAFVWLTMFFGLFCIAADIVRLVTNTSIFTKIPQTFRLYLWLFYYMAGGIAANNIQRVRELLLQHKILKLLPVFGLALSVVLIWIINTKTNRSAALEFYYGNPIVIITVVSSFVLFLAIRKEYVATIVYTLSALIMGVYIIHPFVMSVISHFVPAFIENSLLNIIFWLLTLIICQAISFVMSKIPIVRELIKLS